MQHFPTSVCLPLSEDALKEPTSALESNPLSIEDLDTRDQKPGFWLNISRIKPRFFKETGFFCVPIAGWQAVREDFRIIFDRDPAAHSWLEVLCCYPGFHALILHRFAHWLYRRRVAFVPRLISHLTRFLTGIEIHPGASIGKGVFIDHGMGVVIGETAIVGDYCLIYQGVTLGGTGKETGKRHPTLGEYVVVGAGAKILGNIQVGDYARIGAGSIVLREVPSHCTAVGVPGRNICRTNTETCPLEHGEVPDVQAVAIQTLLDRIENLEQQIQDLRIKTKETGFLT